MTSGTRGNYRRDEELKRIDFQIGQRIKQYRLDLGISMEDCATHLGIHRLAYRRIELGERVLHLHEARALSKLFKRNMVLFLPEELQ